MLWNEKLKSPISTWVELWNFPFPDVAYCTMLPLGYRCPQSTTCRLLLKFAVWDETPWVTSRQSQTIYQCGKWFQSLQNSISLQSPVSLSVRILSQSDNCVQYCWVPIEFKCMKSSWLVIKHAHARDRERNTTYIIFVQASSFILHEIYFIDFTYSLKCFIYLIHFYRSGVNTQSRNFHPVEYSSHVINYLKYRFIIITFNINNIAFCIDFCEHFVQ